MSKKSPSEYKDNYGMLQGIRTGVYRTGPSTVPAAPPIKCFRLPNPNLNPNPITDPNRNPKINKNTKRHRNF